MKLNYRSILITGGTGSFGKAFTKRILARNPEIERLIIFSRDELKQYEMSQSNFDSQFQRNTNSHHFFDNQINS